MTVGEYVPNVPKASTTINLVPSATPQGKKTVKEDVETERLFCAYDVNV